MPEPTTICPACPKHGTMVPRPSHTPEQRWCGDWYVCSDLRCKKTVCVPSAALAKSLADQKASS